MPAADSNPDPPPPPSSDDRLNLALFPAQYDITRLASHALGSRSDSVWLRRRPFGDQALAELHVHPQRWRRTAAHVRAGGGSVACTITVLTGRLRIRQDGREVELDELATSVVDGARPFVIDVAQTSRIIALVVDRDMFARRCAPLGESAAMPPTNRATSDPVAAFLAHLPAALDHPELTTIESQRLGSRALDLLQLVFTPSNPATNVRDEHLTAAKTFIDEHVKDPDLSPRMIAAGTAISIRYLHELFRSTGETVRQRIIRRRLDHAHADLVDPRRSAASISTIAVDNGFKTAAHFSRCFADLYGRTPSDVRSARAADDRATTDSRSLAQ